MPVKRILCLADSRKFHPGRCIAGRVVTKVGPGEWVRPVSARPSEEVLDAEMQFDNSPGLDLLDIVDVPLSAHRPHACQTENWVIDTRKKWSYVRTCGWRELQSYVEDPRTLWINGHSTRHGVNDEIPQAAADALPNSLVLISVPSVELRVFAPSADFGNNRKKVLATFTHRATRYSLRVTDRVIEDNFIPRAVGTYRLGECCLCVSLAEPFEKRPGEWFRYKLVAAIIQRAEVEA